MVKQLIILVVVSVIAVLFRTEIGHLMDLILSLHDRILMSMRLVFSEDKIGLIIQAVIALIAIPLVLGIVLSFAYWVAKRELMPHVVEIVWVVWFIMMTLLILQGTIIESASTPAVHM